jgi:hypothetical protein
MDFSSALKPDVYRVIVINLVPGFVGIAPWVAGVFWSDLQNAGTWKLQGVMIPISVTLAAMVLAAGLIFEDIGSRIEVYWADRWLSRKCQRLARSWRVYLAQRRDDSLIAQGYLRAILVRFKFELSMVPAIFSCMLGLIFAQANGNGLGEYQTVAVGCVLTTLLVMLLDEVRKGAAVLARTRQIVIRASRLR